MKQRHGQHGEEIGTMIENALEAAADWWTDQLRKVPRLDNGDSSPRGAITWALGVSAAMSCPTLSEDQLATFRASLLGFLSGEASVQLRGLRGVPSDITMRDVRRRGSIEHLGCDYGPDAFLAQACAAAGFDGKMRFPWKTTMWIQRGRVRVGEGYCAKPVEIYCDREGLEDLVADEEESVAYNRDRLQDADAEAHSRWEEYLTNASERLRVAKVRLAEASEPEEVTP
jgi:hypothetical protein